MPVINFVDINQRVECIPGTKLRDVAMRVGYDVYPGVFKILNCRGHGMCGTCRVAVVAGRTMPRNETEHKKLRGFPEPWRLACQLDVLDDITVTTNEGRITTFIEQKKQADQEALKAAEAARAARSRFQAEARAREVEAAPARKPAAKKAKPEKAAPAKKPPAKKATEKKPAAETSTGKKAAPAKKAAEKKPKKTAAKKSPAKKA